MLLLFLLGWCEKADKTHYGLFPQVFLFRSSLPGRWADLNLTFFFFFLVHLHCLLQSHSFSASMHKNGVFSLYLSKSPISVYSEAHRVTLWTVPLFVSGAGHLSPSQHGRLKRLCTKIMHQSIIFHSTLGFSSVANKLQVKSGQVFAYTVHHIELVTFNLSFIYLRAWIMQRMPCMCYASTSSKLCLSAVILTEFTT